ATDTHPRMPCIKASSVPYWFAAPRARILFSQFLALIERPKLCAGTRRYEEVTTFRPRSYTLPYHERPGCAITTTLGPLLHFRGSRPRSPLPLVITGRMYPSRKVGRASCRERQ